WPTRERFHCAGGKYTARNGMPRAPLRYTSPHHIHCPGTPMLTLHDYLPSMNGWKVRVLLGQLGIAYQSKPVALFSGASRTQDFLNLNPVGAIPVLELDDGRALAESNAILFFLATDTRFLPAERYAQAKVMQWLFFEQYYVEPTI